MRGATVVTATVQHTPLSAPQRQRRRSLRTAGEPAGSRRWPQSRQPECLPSPAAWTVSGAALSVSASHTPSWCPSPPPGKESQSYHPEELNKRAVAITQRVKLKLTGQKTLTHHTTHLSLFTHQHTSLHTISSPVVQATTLPTSGLWTWIGRYSCS